MKKIFAILGVALIVLILPLFFITNVKAATNINTYGYNTLQSSDNSYSVFVTFPDLEINASVELFYLQNSELTNYACFLKRNQDNDFMRCYSVSFYYIDSVIYTYSFEPGWFIGMLFNCSFVESGIDSSITLKYSFVYITTVTDSSNSNILPIQFQVDTNQTYQRSNFGGLIAGIQIYYHSQYCNLAKFGSFNDNEYSHDITNLNNLNEVVSYWSDKKFGYYDMAFMYFEKGHTRGFTQGYNAALNSDSGVNRFWQLFATIFSGVGSILSLQLFPGITLGVFILLPLAFGIIGLIIWIWRN